MTRDITAPGPDHPARTGTAAATDDTTAEQPETKAANGQLGVDVLGTNDAAIARRRLLPWAFGAKRASAPTTAGHTHAAAGGLEVRGLACTAGRRTVLADVGFSVRAGETIGIVGPNGSGKTTLLRTLAGLTRPVRGDVRVGGQVLHRVSARERARLVALVGQDEQPPADLLVGELVVLGLTPYLPPWGAGGPGEREAVEKALGAVDLAGFAGRAVSRLSGGERQRVLLARALVQDTPLLLLDEPTNHLDITHQLELLTLTRGLERTVVMSLHDLALADRYCDRVLVLHDGGAQPLEVPEIALRTDILDTVFGVHATRVMHPDSGAPHLLITARKAPS
ncbi:ABC transporter ATP-binding protein [Nocardia sp. NPDC051030]|uniref:ABC transporter ATP-binding protein n=1 Tax=Nocardia sp. NPDC051030 TaxID=3155162 RepID=UPI0034190D6E